MKKLFHIFVALMLAIETSLIFIALFIDFKNDHEIKEVFFLDIDPSWADTLISHMSLEEKAGQLIFIELTQITTDSIKETDSLIRHFGIGGIKFTNCRLLNQMILTNYIQAGSKIPLIIGSEGAIVNEDDFILPVGPIINAPGDTVFTDKYFNSFAEILKYEGVHIDFSNNLNQIDTVHPSNGFSDQPSRVIYQATEFRKKLHNNKIISCLNYSDELFNNTNQKAIDSISLEKQDMGIGSYFAIRQPSSVTWAIAARKNLYHFGEFYKKYYQFQGLVFSDIPNTISSEGLELLFNGGTDVFVVKKNIDQVYLKFKELIDKKLISEAEINYKVKRILMAKKWAGLDKQQFRSVELSLSKIYNQIHRQCSWQIYEKSVCLIKNQGNAIPLGRLLNSKVCMVKPDNNGFPFLEQYLNYYIETYSVEFNKEKPQVPYYSTIIVPIERPLNKNSVDSLFLIYLQKLAKSKNLIVINFGNPENIPKLQFARVILYAYDTSAFSQMVAAQAITGSIAPVGHFYPKYAGLPLKVSYRLSGRLQYTIPEAAGFNSILLNRIDTLIDDAISQGAMPGCQILAAKNGKVFYYKSFGHHTYTNGQKVKNSDIYDLASITKVAATTLVSMKLYEKGKIRLDDSLKDYIDDTILCTFKNHQLRDFFLHQTGLQPDMPILQYINYRKPGIGRYDKYYSNKKDTSYSIKVADDYYLRKDYLDSVVLSLYNLEWDSTKPYLYSDINFNIIYDVILRQINGKYVDFLNSNIYYPLQMRTTGFLPLERFDEKRIAPTQEDKYWRKQLLRGTPHDESAALYGGIAGNAGLFSNANDLAILFQMLLNGGSYGGQKIFEKETIAYFTGKQEDASRGLGFSRKDGYFGHTGFTGCVVWANPETQMIFIFLSNSIHPKSTNQKLKRMEIRSRTMDILLNAYKPGTLNKVDLDKND